MLIRLAKQIFSRRSGVNTSHRRDFVKLTHLTIQKRSPNTFSRVIRGFPIVIYVGISIKLLFHGMLETSTAHIANRKEWFDYVYRFAMKIQNKTKACQDNRNGMVWQCVGMRMTQSRAVLLPPLASTLEHEMP